MTLVVLTNRRGETFCDRARSRRGETFCEEFCQCHAIVDVLITSTHLCINKPAHPPYDCICNTLPMLGATVVANEGYLLLADGIKNLKTFILCSAVVTELYDPLYCDTLLFQM